MFFPRGFKTEFFFPDIFFFLSFLSFTTRGKKHLDKCFFTRFHCLKKKILKLKKYILLSLTSRKKFRFSYFIPWKMFSPFLHLKKCLLLLFCLFYTLNTFFSHLIKTLERCFFTKIHTWKINSEKNVLAQFQTWKKFFLNFKLFYSVSRQKCF